jgi:AAA15 family ATPase/GTPase
VIANISIQNFGSIKDKQTLSFEAAKSDELEDYYIIEPVKGIRLLKMLLIYGANASGKTTILKAIEFLRDLVLEPADKKNESLDFTPFSFDSNTPKQSSHLAIDFYQKEIRYYYEIEFNSKAIVTEELFFYSPNKARIFSRKTDLENQFTEISFGTKIKKDKTFEKTLEANTLWNNTVLGGFLKTNIESKELKNVTDWFSDFLQPMIFTKTQLDDFVTQRIENVEIDKSILLSILKKADFNISDIQINDDKEISESIIKFLSALEISNDSIEKIKNTKLKKIEFEHTVDNKKYFLPIKEESQGTQRYYGFAGLLTMLIQDSIAIPIDELEASLHPDLFIHFLLSFLINSKKSQVFATTHNREILNNKDIFRNDAIWFTDKNKQCATELYSLSDFDSKVIRDTSNVYNAYKIGKLGGVPNLGDYYIDIDNEKK